MAGRAVFPLVPTPRLIGLAFGAVESVRRGRGYDVAGSRPYVTGDPVAVDRLEGLGAALVRSRERRVRRARAVRGGGAARRRRVSTAGPRWALPRRLARGSEAGGGARRSSTSSSRARSPRTACFGYLDLAGRREVTSGAPPRSQADAEEVEERLREAPFDAPADGVSPARLEQLERAAPRPARPARFVFVVSDFLDAAAARGLVARRRRGAGSIVPVVVQDPTWEQDFPAIAARRDAGPRPGDAGGLTSVRLSSAARSPRAATANRARLGGCSPSSRRAS